MSAGPGDLSKADLFRELGYADRHGALDAALEEAGLSRPSKQRISREKAPAVRDLLRERFGLCCGRGDCLQRIEALLGGRGVVRATEQALCEVCGGSVNRAAVDEMVGAMARARLRRLCVIGGSPNARRDLESLVDGRVELRLVGDEKKHTKRDAEANTRWADLVVKWGGTQISHKVSNLYDGRDANVVQMMGRGVPELAGAVVQACARRQ